MLRFSVPAGSWIQLTGLTGPGGVLLLLSHERRRLAVGMAADGKPRLGVVRERSGKPDVDSLELFTYRPLYRPEKLVVGIGPWVDYQSRDRLSRRDVVKRISRMGFDRTLIERLTRDAEANL